MSMLSLLLTLHSAAHILWVSITEWFRVAPMEITMAKATIASLVATNIDSLRDMSHSELFAWSRTNGLDSAAGFSNFKKQLLANGIDYEAMRTSARAGQRADLEAQATAGVTLYCDAKARTNRFAICDAAGAPVWYGRFFDDDRDYDGEQSSGEMAAAKKAVWLAGKIRDAIGAPTLRLALKVDAEWLVFANRVADGAEGGGKARALGELARKLNLLLTVEWIAGSENPADQYTVAQGYLRWQDADLKSLVS